MGRIAPTQEVTPMADEGTSASEGSGSEDSDASGMLFDAVNDDDGSQGDSGEQSDDVAKLREQLAKANKEAATRRKRIKELEPLADEAKKLRDSQKSELEKLTERASGAEDRATAAELASMRLEVALDKAPEGMPVSKIRTLAKRLSGTSQEELESDAEELFAEFAPPKKDEDDTGKSERPKERLSSVRLPNSENIRLDDETDPRKLAANIRRL